MSGACERNAWCDSVVMWISVLSREPAPFVGSTNSGMIDVKETHTYAPPAPGT
jgi:hypothetical protein